MWPTSKENLISEPQLHPEWRHAVTLGAFGHGYLLTSDSHSPPSLVEGWERQKVDGLTLYSNPRTRVTVSASRPAGLVLFLGDPLDVDHQQSDPSVIAADILRTLDVSGPEAAVRHAAHLAGRWTMIILHGRRWPTFTSLPRSPHCWIVPDTMGTQGSFYATSATGFHYASSPTLVAASANLGPRSDLEEVRAQIKKIRPQGVTYLPGAMTAYDGVQPIIPNCLLEIERNSPENALHRRFWPWQECATTTNVDEVYEQYTERFGAYMGLVARQNRIGVSLTGGLDSTATLAHLHPHMSSQDFAFTYFNANASTPGAATDVFIASQIAGRLGLQHRVLQWRNPQPESPYAEIYARTHPLHYASHGAAHAMWADLPSDFIHVNSLAGEIGTTMTRARDYREPDPAWYAGFWLGPKFTKVRRYLDIYEHYLEYTNFSQENLAGFDQHNVAYWELRIGKWGYTKFIDADQGHRCIPAFNDRRLFEIMLRLPQEHLVGKTLYHRTLAEKPQFDPTTATPVGRSSWRTGDDKL